MFATIQRALALVQIILGVAAASIPGAAKTVQFVDPAVAKAQALLTSIAGFTTPANAAAALDELAQLVTILQQQNMIPPSVTRDFGFVQELIVKGDAMLHNYLAGQAVPLGPISVEGKPGFAYAIPNDATAEINAALGR